MPCVVLPASEVNPGHVFVAPLGRRNESLGLFKRFLVASSHGRCLSAPLANRSRNNGSSLRLARISCYKAQRMRQFAAISFLCNAQPDSNSKHHQICSA